MANNNAAPKYNINTHMPGNTRIFAQMSIQNGEEIVAERPLDQLVIGLEDTFNPDHVLNQIKEFNASHHLDVARAAMSHADRDALDQLHKTTPDGGLASTWATNSFSFQHERDGQTYTSLGIFNHISRANHSCQPNAIFTWNAQRGVGTFYALQSIRAGAEIKIEYWPNAEQSLRTGRKRTDDLNKYYGFQCRCDSCYVAGQGNDHRNKSDDKLRSKAGRLLKDLDTFKPANNESAAESAVRQMGIAQEHREALEELGVKDMKLANVFGRLARAHEESFDTATPEVHRQGCIWCDGGRDRIIHLQQARKYLAEENRIHIRCWGLVHAELADDYAKQAALQVKINLATR